MAAAGGIAVANLYYNQPMLPDIARSFGISADVIALLPMLTQVGYAIGLFLFVPLGDIMDRHQLVLALHLGIIVSLVGLAVAPSLVWLDMAGLTLGMTSALAQVLVAFAAQLSRPSERGRIVGTLQAGMLAARTVSGTVSAYLGWRLMFWLAAAVNLALFVVLHRVLPRTRPAVSLPYSSALWSLNELWRSYPQLRTSSVIGALLFAAFSVFWSTLAFHLAGPPFGYGPQVAGLFGLLGAAGAASAPVTGQMTDRRGAAFTVAIGSLLTTAAFVVFGLAEGSLVVLALGVVLLDVGHPGGHERQPEHDPELVVAGDQPHQHDLHGLLFCRRGARFVDRRPRLASFRLAWGQRAGISVRLRGSSRALHAFFSSTWLSRSAVCTQASLSPKLSRPRVRVKRSSSTSSRT
jgi:predicted MFS family arabinose efflux permease